MSLQENTVRNDRYAEQICLLLQEKPNITTRAISKETGIDKRLVNQILYFTPGVQKNADRIPKWSLVVAPRPAPQRRVLPSIAFNTYMAHNNNVAPTPLQQRVRDGITYVYLPLENPDTAPCHTSREEALEAREAIREAREVAEVAAREARKAAEAREAREAAEAEEAEDDREPELECSSCGASGAYELMDCSEGMLCGLCADEVDAASGQRRRDM